MKELQKPRCLAMILCDAVYRDSASGKFTLLGIFDFLGGKRLPIEADFSVYICATDALGDVPLAVRIVPADSLGEQPLAQVQGMLHAANPLAILQLTLRVKTAFHTAGLYHCELVSGDEVLMSRRLVVRLADGEGG